MISSPRSRQLSYQASHDSLTGLINRREFENRLVMALEKLHGNPDQEHALLYLDLERPLVFEQLKDNPSSFVRQRLSAQAYPTTTEVRE